MFDLEFLLNSYILHEGCIVSENSKVIVIEDTHRLSNYYDVILKTDGKEDFILGRYSKEELKHSLFVKYNEGKILIYYGEFDFETKDNSKVFKVLNLYNVEDGMFYAVSEEEALKIFNLNTLKNELLESDKQLVEFNVNSNSRQKVKKYVS